MKNIFFLIFFIPFTLYSQDKQNPLSKDFFLMFYNVENLFDTIDNPKTNDNTFLPSSKKKYNTYKYNHKLSQLAKVFLSVKQNNNGKLPDIIGLCEVENKLVIDDLLKQAVFNDHDYTIIHKDSPDSRGIDCALLVNNRFKLIKKDYISVLNPDSKRSTRDIVFAKLNYNNHVFNLFVNHWPSRWGGQFESNHKRVYAAKVLKRYIEQNTNDNEYTLVMGDFNDHPDNESVKDVLVSDDFINLMDTDLSTGLGSYNYKGDWNWLDQIIFSKNFVDNCFKVLSGGSFYEKYMLYENKNGVMYPSRSFGGDKYYGGFSDHLPIYCKFSFICK
mgnify:CR=1 FL=1